MRLGDFPPKGGSHKIKRKTLPWKTITILNCMMQLHRMWK